MNQEDRMNMVQFGWANGMRNMAFVAGRLRRNPINPKTFYLQQTVNLAQSIPVITRYPLADAFPDGSYVSTFARLRGHTIVDEHGAPGESGVVLQGLHTRFANGQEVNPDTAQRRLMYSLERAPKGAEVSTDIRPMDIQTPDEIKGFIGDEDKSTTDEVSDDPFALKKSDSSRLIRNGNRVVAAGVIGFMELRQAQHDNSQARLLIYLQQNSSLGEAFPVRIYGKQALLLANVYRPGHAITVTGEVFVDVKGSGESMRATPYLRTFSVENAQTPHIKISPYPQWAHDLYKEGATDAGFARLTRFVKEKPKSEEPAGHALAA